MVPVEDELIGQQIGNYVLKKLLGKGGMGSVYLAEHPRIEKQVAVKILSEYVIQQPMAAQRFEAEAKLISRVNHPNIIEVFDFGALEDGRLYYIMEMLEGRELRKVMKAKRRMSPRDLLPYLEQICAALQAAHDKGVIHRDLKPENIFVLDREPLTLKVLDFGVAKLLETDNDVESTAVGVVVGTPLLVAPEQAASKPDLICKATDLYSLGVLLFWILSGRPPFVADAPGILMAMHIMDDPPLLTERAPNVPLSVARVVHQCLEKDPSMRPGSAVDVYTAFAKAVEEADSSDSEEEPPIIELSTALDPWGMVGSSGDGAASSSVDGEVSISGDGVVSISGDGVVSISGDQEISLTGPQPEVCLTGPMPPTSNTGPMQVFNTPSGINGPSVTTQGGASGEVSATAARGHSMVWTAVGAVAALVILAGGLLMYLYGNVQRGAPAVTAKAPPVAKVAAKPPPGPAVEALPVERRTIKIEVAGGQALCRFKNSAGDIKEIASPCTYATSAGDQVEVKVTSEGHEPYSRSWTAEEDLSLALQIDQGTKRITTASGSTPAVAAAPTGVQPKAGVTKKKGKKRKARKPGKKRRPRKPAKKFVPVGEGTMEVDL